MAKLEIVNVLGEKVSTTEISDAIFAIEPHNQAMFDTVLSERSALRQGTHKTKTRTEVSGGGRKPWRQKGTGRARQGSIRSPQWRGGGIVFGPTPQKNYEIKVNKKVRKLAMKSGWSSKVKEGKLILVEDINFQKPATQDFLKMLNNIKANERKVLLVLNGDEKEYNTFLSARNLENVLPVFVEEILLDDLLNANVIVTTEDALKNVEGKLS
ncbi:MAG: 50S ribosomal protein L4 [Candidatus Tyloplasma litorale]|nr:MAG: 50S ribosomal protein L4 [Mycoplasmatales bacterium]